MTLVRLGEIREINRYPVKSFAGERLEECRLEKHGLFGDRCYAFVDETLEGWKSFITARKVPQMLTYRASVTSASESDDLPEVGIEGPDGRRFAWDEKLRSEIQQHFDKTISMRSYPTSEHDLLAVDAAGVLLITDASLRELEANWGKNVDPRRFRANLVVVLDDEAMPEGEWIGRRLAVGSSELRVDEFCERCVMITYEPDSLDRDPSLLRTVHVRMNTKFGVYAAVTKPGRVRLGDPVVLLP
jgi:uncharacterized protein